ncbi:helix-turn-helix domain-containing protein [Sulfobacillus thermosulfidooxidans]|uniref:helix-turn-helix domain-containing protein n=1 Tax=Sulfobacillus thermosulfidooxidans TaxID=28034 RepID=UPI0006B417F9|nr:RodZ domain-containing protein [Sulfobacillus thermosulfidooxidans]
MDTSANNGPVNIGQVLNQARIRRRLSIDQVSEALHIRREYILALEQNRWDDLPGEVYGQGFLKNYGRLVDLDGDALVEERRRQIGQPIDHPPILPMEPLARTGLYTHSTSRSLRSEPPPRKRRFSRESGEAPDYSSPSILVWLLVALAVLFVGGLIMLQHSARHTHAHVATKPAQPSSTHHAKKVTTSASHHSTSANSVNISLQSTSQSGKLFYANYTVSKTPISVSLSFTNDCWVEGIVNGVPQPGKLYYGGQQVTFRGSQSVGVILGSHAVNVSVDGQNVPLPSPSYVLDMTFQG